jgi:cell division protein FtsB
MKRLVSILLLLLVVYFSWLSWFGRRGTRSLATVEKEIARTRGHIQELKAENQRLARRIRLLQSDRRYQELVVRRDLQMIRENEILFVFPSHEPAGEPTKSE